MQTLPDIDSNSSSSSDGDSDSTLYSARCRQLFRGGGWRGWHCEGDLLTSLFGMLMWDEVYAPVRRVEF